MKFTLSKDRSACYAYLITISSSSFEYSNRFGQFVYDTAEPFYTMTLAKKISIRISLLKVSDDNKLIIQLDFYSYFC